MGTNMNLKYEYPLETMGTPPMSPEFVKHNLVHSRGLKINSAMLPFDNTEEEKSEQSTSPHPCRPNSSDAGDLIVVLGKQQMVPSPCPLFRNQSDSSKGQTQRRCIFSHLRYQPQNGRPRSLSDPFHDVVPTKTHQRSSSDSFHPSPSEAKKTVDYRRFKPSEQVLQGAGEHFRNMRKLPDSYNYLPAVPVPLQRFYHEDGSSACLSGAYPMFQQLPILKSSSFNRLPGAGEQTPQPSPSDIIGKVFNLTESGRGDCSKEADDRESNTSTHSSCSSGGTRKSVHFDPRITVTEYPDDFERQWFSEVELERFKCDTIHLAQKYLLKHRALIDQYNRPFRDHVTGTMRKRALFSLPVLSAIDDSDDEDTVKSRRKHSVDMKEKYACLQPSPPQTEFKHLPEDGIERILVVDRNELILDLFRRSLHCIFPAAVIATAQTAEEALKMYETSKGESKYSGDPRRGYDIVIAEERLHSPLYGPSKHYDVAGKSDSFPQGLSQCGSSTPPRFRSFTNLACVPEETETSLSGSKLFQTLCEAETVLDEPCLTDTSSALLPLLIGVSTSPEQESKMFFEHGADFVWGKPPPIMDDRLRYQLTLALTRKRGKSLCALR